MRNVILKIIQTLPFETLSIIKKMNLNISISEREFEKGFNCGTSCNVKNNSIHVIFIERSHSNLSNLTKSCNYFKVFFSKKRSLNEITSQIRQKIIDLLYLNSQNEQYSHCKNCPCNKKLTNMEEKILLKLASGANFNRMYKELGIGYKCLMQHKYYILNKFNLKGNSDLIAFSKEVTIHQIKHNANGSLTD
ncbi:TPA: hypothetical protein NPN74_005230 [Klebsiella quasipneumoniae subsp. quasipneumoniae]|nr:hypothetical protein [Klebsiella quasipneumoniae subsp. quasipneumoniae]